MTTRILHGFKVYAKTDAEGTHWTFVALKPEHPYFGKAPSELPVHGCIWTSTSDTYDFVRSAVKPEGPIGSPGEWIVGFADRLPGIAMSQAMTACIAFDLATRYEPPKWMVDDFCEHCLPEPGAADTPKNRRAAWAEYLKLCTGNAVLTAVQAGRLQSPEGLLSWTQA
jgi:hypothetical protein